ncbi:M48 family metallopeptidase [Ferroplasma sp.]|uniref:M48 metallopeptidase family protein n=1 Tax=Ferroplasma sp. TaxID=2591003 RepID=UPI00261691C8|nr:M48 family metallopeptidase [Ferroplasma sp.]
MNKIEFINMIDTIADIMEVKPNEIQIRRMKRKWGSCSSKGRLTFNIDLLDKNNDFIREAIIHELLHLRYEKHDTLFNNLLNIYKERTENIDKNKDTEFIRIDDY